MQSRGSTAVLTASGAKPFTATAVALTALMAFSTATNSEPGTQGTFEVRFESWIRGTVKYDLPGQGLSGEVPIQRIVNDNVALCRSPTND